MSAQPRGCGDHTGEDRVHHSINPEATIQRRSRSRSRFRSRKGEAPTKRRNRNRNRYRDRTPWDAGSRPGRPQGTEKRISADRKRKGQRSRWGGASKGQRRETLRRRRWGTGRWVTENDDGGCSLSPRRILFSVPTPHLRRHGIEVVAACTLAMLRTGQF